MPLVRERARAPCKRAEKRMGEKVDAMGFRKD
jgi:hypothetical protein